MEKAQQLKEYHTPQLVEYGDLTQITQSSGRGGGDTLSSFAET